MWTFIVNWFVKITAYIPQKIVFRTKVYYQDKSAQSRKIKKQAIVISNHRSLMDFAMLMFLFPFRILRCVVAEIMFRKNFLFTFFLKSMGAIKVEREIHDFSFLEKCEKLLAKNRVVEIFPEARLPKKGESLPLEFKPSTVYLSLSSGAPIIPVFTDGNYFTKKRNRVIVGTPFYSREYYDESLTEKENIQIITNKLREKIIELEHELSRKIERQHKN